MSMIESGIPGFDELSYYENANAGGFPEKTVTLIYGPPKTGKSIFSYQFSYHGLMKEQPCLYLLADYGIRQLQQNMTDFGWFIQAPMKNEMIYAIDSISRLSGVNKEISNVHKLTAINNPTDIMVKLGLGTRFTFKRSNLFRSIFDSMTTLFAFNPDKLVIRLFKAYVRRLTEAGGTAIVNYTEGSADPKIESKLKLIADNTIRLDRDYLTIERMGGIKDRESAFKITDKGITL